MTDFEVHWQNYFTALDELAKATIAQYEAEPIHVEGFTQKHLAEHRVAVGKARVAQQRLVAAHLALKPFLEDDGE